MAARRPQAQLEALNLPLVTCKEFQCFSPSCLMDMGLAAKAYVHLTKDHDASESQMLTCL